MARILVVHAHPYPRRSRAGRLLLSGVEDLPQLEVRSLYERYPEFDIDVGGEQQALRDAELVVWQCPFYWYGVPSLMSHWFEKVLVHGFAHGAGGDALLGKPLLWVTTTGTPLSAYSAQGMHLHSFQTFVAPIEQTARFCGMRWESPLVVHGASDIADEELDGHARDYRARLHALTRASGAPGAARG